jgi:hypothetical protein
LVGFTSLKQVDENLKALDVYAKWDKNIEE